eukprot:325671-Amorphochlora_amoeboformis.AAC.1
MRAMARKGVKPCAGEIPDDWEDTLNCVPPGKAENARKRKGEKREKERRGSKGKRWRGRIQIDSWWERSCEGDWRMGEGERG